MKTHTCIKPACGSTYQSNEEDAYYCPSCVETNKAIAKQIDAQVAARPKRNTHSEWKAYEESQKVSARGLEGVIVKI